MTPHPSHNFVDHYCTQCGTFVRSLTGSVQAPCTAVPDTTPTRTPQGHEFNDLSGRCARCGAHCMSIDAKLRCVPVDVESGIDQ